MQNSLVLVLYFLLTQREYQSNSIYSELGCTCIKKMKRQGTSVCARVSSKILLLVHKLLMFLVQPVSQICLQSSGTGL